MTKNKQVTFILILQVLYFTQIYPFIHFHHTHNDDRFHIAISIHPIDGQTENHNRSHSDDHHHTGQEHYISDWTYTKPQPKQEVDPPTTFCLGRAFVTPQEPDLFGLILRFIAYSLPQKTHISSDLARSPPHLS